MALTDKLTAIGDAIREKTGKTELLTLDAMPLEIASIETGGGGGIEPFVLTGDCSNGCGGVLAGHYINAYGDTITTKDLTNLYYMFENYTNETIPFDLNCKAGTNVDLSYLFSDAEQLKTLPRINNCRPSSVRALFYGCYRLREIPEDYFDNWDCSYLSSSNAGGTSASSNNIFAQCYSLRKAPVGWLRYMNKKANYNYSYLYNIFYNCYALDEVLDLPLIHDTTYTTNLFYSSFNNMMRVKEIIFELDENGLPPIKNIKSQTIDLSNRVGYVTNRSYALDYNSGITADKEVKDDATYQALKNDHDWFTAKKEYSRYNKTSAINTINTLPDTSAYLATAGGTNTIKFTGVAGANTDGGAINTLTAEEIAVATAKGWTVTLS